MAIVAVLALSACGDTEPKPDANNDTFNGTTTSNGSTGFDGTSVRGSSTFTFALVATDDGEQITASDYEPEWDEETCPVDCEGNTAPQIDEPLFVVNGRIEPTAASRLDDDFAILVAFRDTECNLSCGTRSDSKIEPEGGGDGTASLASNVPCSTEESNVYFRLTPASYPLDPGHYEYSVWLQDACGAQSERRIIEFDLE